MTSSTKRGCVLVVEDEPQVRRVLERVCQQAGFRAVLVPNGERALAHLRGGEGTDVVLLDLLMPGLDGLGVLQSLRDAPVEPAPAVLVISSATDPLRRAQAIELGAMDYITKPFRIADLKRRVCRAMSIIHTERRLAAAERQLRELREKDEATGVEAAGQLFFGLEAEFYAAQGGQRALSCIVVSDENYDTTLSHQGRGAGVARLHHLADVIEDRLSGSDRVFRVDAAEFVILLPGTGRTGTVRLMDEILAMAQAEGMEAHELVMAAACYPHPELSGPSLMYRAVNITLAQARSGCGRALFEGF